MVLDGKSSQEYPVNDRGTQDSILGPIFILSVIKHMIRGNNWNWLLNLNLIYETLWTEATSGLLISMLEKLD